MFKISMSLIQLFKYRFLPKYHVDYAIDNSKLFGIISVDEYQIQQTQLGKKIRPCRHQNL